ncbi:hypothetical protein X975_16489, partial [Stegodyphus mimosarum]
MNGHGSNPGLSSGRGSSSPLPLTYYPPHNSTQLPLNLAPPQENGIYGNHALSSGEEDNCNSIPSTPNPMVMPQQEALNLEVSRNSTTSEHRPLNMASRRSHGDEGVTPAKRLLTEEERLTSRSSMPSTH